MRQWISNIDSFRHAIWQKIVRGGTIESSIKNNQRVEPFVELEIPLDSFRIFGFLDDTGFRTSAPDIEARRTIFLNMFIFM